MKPLGAVKSTQSLASALTVYYSSCRPLLSIPSPSLLSDWFVPPVSKKPEFLGSVHHIEDVRQVLEHSGFAVAVSQNVISQSQNSSLHPAASLLWLKHRDDAGVNGVRGWFNLDRQWRLFLWSWEGTGLNVAELKSHWAPPSRLCQLPGHSFPAPASLVQNPCFQGLHDSPLAVYSFL